MFPTNYTQFNDKKNADYNGDPKGDYILAEHINSAQDAIESIEKAVGLSSTKDKSMAQRIKDLETVQTMRLPMIGYFSGSLGNETSYLISVLSQYQTVLLSERSSITDDVIAGLKEKSTVVYGQVNALTSLTLIQNEVGAWKAVGAEGIYLTNLGEEASPTRIAEQAILSSIEQAGLAVLIETAQLPHLISDTAVASYNATGAALVFPKKTILQLDNFAYNQRAYVGTELLNTTKPLIEAIRSKGLEIAGFANAPTQDLFNYVQATGLLFGLDYLHNGPTEGYTLSNRSPVYNWPSYLLNWKTTNPLIFREGTALYRDIPNGRIWLYDNLTIKIDGYALDSGLINWYNNTLPGSAIQEGTIDPGKLSTYDIQRIVDLLNSSDDAIKIDATKIKADEGGGNLPINIPASNMVQNTIQAINQKNNVDTTNQWTIENWAIESLDAAKLTGDLKKEQLLTHVVDAINESSTLMHFIDAAKLKAINIDSTGTISGNTLVADNATLRALNVTEGLSAVDATVSNYFTGNMGEFYQLYVEQLTVDKLMGLKELHVETLTADNIGALVLEAINANITNATFVNVVTQALTAETIKTDLITALNSVTDKQITNTGLFGTAVIDDASIKSVSAGKLTAGSINTALINLSSDAGHLKINDSTMEIYDDIDINGNRKLRVLIGDLSSLGTVAVEQKYGMVVLGEDGSTRLYDNTGVYNAGLHDNVISETKIQDDAISERVIQAGAIITEHLQAGIINADKIGADAILAKHILAGEIVGSKIAGETITGSNIQAGAISAGHITAGSITSTKIGAHAITADKLTIGFLANVIRDGYDSFEQSETGNFKGVILAGTSPGVITKDWSFDGDKSFYLMGNSASNRVRLAVAALDYTIPVMPGVSYFVSSYIKTVSTSDVPLTLGLAFNNGTVLTSSIKSVTKMDRVTRISHVFTAPTGALRASLVLGVEATNVGVWFDCLQVEEMTEGQTEPGFWKPTATTKIDGASISTGYIDASHIHIGGGTLFGTNSDIIDITDEGIKAKSQTGWAMLNSKGIEITGGAFSLTSGVLGQNSVSINGQEGITTETPLNRIEMNALTGFRIIDKAGEKVLFDTDPETGAVRIAGSLRVYDVNNPAMAWSLDEKISGIEADVSNVLEDYVTALDVQGLQDQIDGSISTWFGDSEPTMAKAPATSWTTTILKDNHLGDLYYDDITGYAYRFSYKNSLYSWLRITDSDITLALATANTAQDTADGKRRVFTTTPTTPYDSGDLWAGGVSAELMRCSITRATGSYQASDWQLATKYTDNARAEEAAGLASTAKGIADSAQANASTANNLLADVSNDNKLTAGEKSALKIQWDSINAEFDKNKATAANYAVATTAYHNAYSTLSGIIGSSLTDASLTTTSAINGVTLRSDFKAYYDQRQILLDAITEALNQKSLQLAIELSQATSDTVALAEGNPAFTTKAQAGGNVFVEIDGLSQQRLNPNARNMIHTNSLEWEDGHYSLQTGAKEGYGTRIRMPYLVKVNPYTSYHWNSFGEYLFLVRAYDSSGALSNSWGSIGTNGARTTTGSESYLGISLFSTGDVKTSEEIKADMLSGALNPLFQLNGVSDKSFEEFIPSAPSPDYPIEINSLDKSFDIVSSVGERNLIPNTSAEWGNALVTSTVSFYGTYSLESLGLKAGDIVTWSVDYDFGDYRLSLRISTTTNSIGPILTGSGAAYQTATIPSGATSLNLFLNNNGNNGTHIDNFNVMLRKSKLIIGTIKTAYSQAPEEIQYNTQTPTLYKTNILLAEPLRSVGNVKDRVFLDTDGLWKVKRNIGEYQVNGSENWILHSTYTDSTKDSWECNMPLNQIRLAKRSSNGRSNMFVFSGTSNTPIGTISIVSTSQTYITFSTVKGKYSNSTEVKSFLSTTDLIVQYELQPEAITIETLSAEQQTYLNNIASFKDSNYVYTTAEIVPNLKATFKSASLYRYTQSLSTINNLKQSMDATKDINIGMKIGYSSFSVQTANSLYFCGFQSNPVTLDDELADINGMIFNRQTKETIAVSKQAISLSGVPLGTSGYIVWENTLKQILFIYYTKVMGTEAPSSAAWKTHLGTSINLTDSVYVIGEMALT